MNIDAIPTEVTTVLKRIMDKGHEAYIVGGALRDYILNRPIQDWDIATSLLPNEIEATFNDVHKVIVGKRFGTIQVFIDNTPIEITTYRTEECYRDFRHPSNVNFTTNIYEDLKRRDFTMNSLAFNPLLDRKSFVDPYGGYQDIKNKIIRTVGNPNERFFEDPLRMMRAIRFASQLGFNIDKDTLSAIDNNSKLIKNISAERIKEELEQILLGEFTSKAIILLYSLGIQEHIIPESRILIDQSYMEYIASYIDKCSYNIVERLCMFLIWTTKLKDRKTIINKILKRLKYDNQTRQDVINILSTLDTPINYDLAPYFIRKTMASIGVKNTITMLNLKELLECQSNNISKLKKIAFIILKENHPISRSQLEINGHDIMKLGIGVKDERQIGQALNMVYDWVLMEPTLNDRNILIEKLKRHYKDKK